MTDTLKNFYISLEAGGYQDSEWNRLANVPKEKYTYRGKVRDIFDRGETVELFHSDRLSAFDKHIAEVPGKGIILAHLSAFWLKLLEAKELKTHFVSWPNPRTLYAKKLRMIPVELVVRGYLAGSMLKEYKEGKRVFSGQQVPEGLKPFQRLERPLLTPTTKAEAYSHDEETSAKEILAKGIVTESQWQEISNFALQVFEIGSLHCLNKGLILVDTKYEFGFSSNGEILIGDEVHTPDSSRFWENSSYEERLKSGQEPVMFDKQIVRNWLIEQGYTGQSDFPPPIPRNLLLKLAKSYLEVSERLTSQVVEF